MTIYVTVDENNQVRGWSSSKGSNPNEQAVDIAEDDPFLSDIPFYYIYQDGKLVKSAELQLADLKESKINELSMACNQAILGEFTTVINGVTYSFSNDEQAQQNFKDAKLAFMSGDITEITWTAYDSNGKVTRLQLNKQTFNSVYMAHLNHTLSNISKFRDTLQPQVEACTTIDQLNAITWE